MREEFIRITSDRELALYFEQTIFLAMGTGCMIGAIADKDIAKILGYISLIISFVLAVAG